MSELTLREQTYRSDMVAYISKPGLWDEIIQDLDQPINEETLRKILQFTKKNRE